MLMLATRLRTIVHPFILCAALLSACAPRITQEPSPQPQATVPEDFPEAYYRHAQAQRKILRVDSGRSLVTIAVRRGGIFGRLGHDHVVASHHVAGFADPHAGRTDLYVPLQRLAVDEPELRAEAHLDTQPSQEDIESTRHNMLTRVLEVERYPFALIHAEYATADRSMLRVAITLHGVKRTFDVPVHIEQQASGIAVSGQLAIKQTDFGIVPMSILGGAIQVQDSLDMRFRIVAM
jgi:polyisoprenoid-binding protein YceI